MTVHMHNDS